MFFLVFTALVNIAQGLALGVGFACGMALAAKFMKR